MKHPRNPLVALALDVVVLLAVHAVLQRVLADQNIVATIFASGGDAPFGVVALALAFIAIRLLITLALPGVILARLGLIALQAWQDRQRARPGAGTAGTKTATGNAISRSHG